MDISNGSVLSDQIHVVAWVSGNGDQRAAGWRYSKLTAALKDVARSAARFTGWVGCRRG